MISIVSIRSDAMAQVVVRQLEEGIKERLKQRAKRHGRSVEAEVREILRIAVYEGPPSVPKLGSRIAARFKGKGLGELPELRGQSPRGADFSR
jgi:plasmid stability protein